MFASVWGCNILLDETLYPRNQVHYLAIDRYTKALKTGAVLPPILVGKRGGRYVVIDGWHRYHAKSKLGEAKIAAVLTQLPEKQWFMEAVRLNVIHGKPLSHQEKLSACMGLQRDGFSLEQIQTTVGEDVAVWQNAVKQQGHWISSKDVKPVILKAAVAKGLQSRSEPPTKSELKSIAAAQTVVHSRSCEALVRELLAFLNNDFAPVTDKSVALLAELQETLSEWLQKPPATEPV
jgi:hypothetical protein